MKTNAAALEIIKRNEGLRLEAYQDVVGVWTIGYGDTGPDVKRGLRITADEAERRLAARLAREFEPGVMAAIGSASTTENEFGAMVSLAYNIGVGAFAGSTVARMHKAGNHKAAAEAFALWDKAGGKVLAGLVRRRQEEAALYLTPATLEVKADNPVENSSVSEAAVDAVNPVEMIRQAQRAVGFTGADVDGDAGPLTRAAVNRWRTAHPEA